jgi:hypothetical protein
MPPGLKVAKRLEARRPFKNEGSADSIERHGNALASSSRSKSNGPLLITRSGDQAAGLVYTREREAELDADNGGQRSKLDGVWARSKPDADVSAEPHGPSPERRRRIDVARTPEGVERGPTQMADSATRGALLYSTIRSLPDPASGGTGYGREGMGCTDTERAAGPPRSADRPHQREFTTDIRLACSGAPTGTLRMGPAQPETRVPGYPNGRAERRSCRRSV